MMRNEKEENRIIRQLEKFLRGFITVFGRRLSPCDSHIRLCFFCVQLRFLLRRRKPSKFWIETKHATYVFRWQNNVELIKVFVNPTLRDSLEFWRCNKSQLRNVFTFKCNRSRIKNV